VGEYMDDYLIEFSKEIDRLRWDVERMRTYNALLGSANFTDFFYEEIDDIRTLVKSIRFEFNYLIKEMIATKDRDDDHVE